MTSDEVGGRERLTGAGGKAEREGGERDSG